MEEATAEAAAGAGGIAGWLIGVLAAIPGVGPFIAAGPSIVYFNPQNDDVARVTQST